MAIVCRLITETDREIGKELNLNPSIVSTYASIYLSENSQKTDVDKETLKNYIANSSSSEEDVDLFINLYQAQENLTGNNGSKIPFNVVNGVITLDKDAKINDYVPYLKNILSSVKGIQEFIDNNLKTTADCQRFAIWMSAYDIQHGNKQAKEGSFSVEAVNEAIRKTNKLHETSKGKQEAEQQKNYDKTYQYVQKIGSLAELETVLKTKLAKINGLISFDEDSHKYTVGDKQADFSVTRLTTFLYQVSKGNKKISDVESLKEEEKEAKEGSYLEVSSLLGLSHDKAARDFFSGKDILKESYPNMTSEDVASFLKQLEEAKQAIQDQHPGKKLSFITDESLLRLAANIHINGKDYLVGGTMDLLVADEDGNLFPYDFKTKRGNDNENFSNEQIEKYSNQVKFYSKILSILMPEKSGKIHPGGLVQFNVSYEKPYVEGGTLKYSADKKAGQVYVDGKEIQEVMIGKPARRAYLPGEFKGITTPAQTVNQVNQFSIPKAFREIVNSNEVAPQSGLDEKYKDAISLDISDMSFWGKSIIDKITQPNNPVTAITMFDRKGFDFNKVKEGDIVKLNGKNKVVYVKVTKPWAEVNFNASSSWAKRNGFSTDYLLNVRKKIADSKNTQKVFELQFELEAIDEQATMNKQNYLQQKAEKAQERVENRLKGIDSEKVTALNEFKLYTGSSTGADSEWTKAAKQAGITIVSLSEDDFSKLDKESQEKYKNMYAEAAKLLKRRITTDKKILSKMYRSMANIDYADSVIAIGHLTDSGIAGGTAYACAAGKQKGIPVYLYDMSKERWLRWGNDGKYYVQTEAPKLTPHAAVIGSRDEFSSSSDYILTSNGKNVIKEVIEQAKEDWPAKSSAVVVDNAEGANLEEVQNQMTQQIAKVSKTYLENQGNMSQDQSSGLLQALNKLVEQNQLLIQKIFQQQATQQQQPQTQPQTVTSEVEAEQNPASDQQEVQLEEKKVSGSSTNIKEKASSLNLTSLAEKPEKMETSSPTNLTASNFLTRKYYRETKKTRIDEMYSRISPEKLQYRVQFLAHQIALKLGNMAYQAYTDAQEAYDAAKAANNVALMEAQSKRVAFLSDPVKRMQFVAKNSFVYNDQPTSGFVIAVEEIKKQIKRSLTEAQSKQDDGNKYKVREYTTLLEFFPEIMNESSNLIEQLCFVKVDLKTNNIECIDSKEDEDETGNDEDNESVSGNDGWGVNMHDRDPHKTQSSQTKALLINLYDYDASGKVKKDDLGNPVFLDPLVAHNILLSECAANVTKAEDFCLKRIAGKDHDYYDEGDTYWEFPFFNRLKNKYPWVSDIMFQLENNGQLVSALYHDLRQVFVQYIKIDQGKTIFMNERTGENSLMIDMQNNFDNCIILTKEEKDSIYHLNENNEIVYSKDAILSGATIADDIRRKLLQPVKKALGDKEVGSDEYNEVIEKYKWKFEEQYEKISHLCKKIGINISPEEVGNIVLTYESPYDAMDAMVKSLHDIYVSLKKKDINTKEEYDFIANETSQIRVLGSVFGSVKDSSRMATFKVGRKQHSSYSAPNYLNKLRDGIKIKNEKKRREFFKKEFKQFDFLCEGNGKWKGNTSIDYGAGNKDTVHCLLSALEKNIDGIRDKFEFVEVMLNTNYVHTPEDDGSLAEYANWTEMQKLQNELVMFSAWSETNENLGRYLCPIFADSEHAVFFTGQRISDIIEDNPLSGEREVFESSEATISRLLARVAIQEINRINLVIERKKEIEKGNVYGIDNFDTLNRGASFCFLPWLNDYTEADEVSGVEKDIFKLLKEQSTIEDKEEFLSRIIEEHYNQTFEEWYSDKQALISTLLSENEIPDFHFKDVRSRTDVEIKDAIAKRNKDLEKEGKDPLTKEEEATFKNQLFIQNMAKNFYFNRIYNQSQILQMTVGDLAFNKNMEDFQKRFKEFVAKGLRANTESMYGKKEQSTLYLKENTIISNTIESVKKGLEQAKKEGRITEQEVMRVKKELSKINPTDGQSFRSLEGYRAVLDMFGMWGDREQRAYDNIKSNTWTFDDMNVIFEVIKNFTFSKVTVDFNGKKIAVPTQIKNSEFPLLACYQIVNSNLRTPKLVALSKFMEDYKIDVACFSSGIKNGCFAAVDMDEKCDKYGHSDLKAKDYYDLLKERVLQKDESGNEVVNPDIVHQISYDDYMEAQPTPPHAFDEEVNIGSQQKTLNGAWLPNDPNFRITVGGKELTKSEYQDLYSGVYKQKMFRGYKRLKQNFTDIKSLQKFLLSQIEGNPKYGPELKQALQLVERVDSEGNKFVDFNVSLNHPSIQKQIESILLSAFKNNVTRQKMPGAANILIADFENLLEVKYKEDVKTGDVSLDYVECYMPWHTKEQLAKFLIRKVDSRNREYYEIDYKKIETEAPGLLEAIGFRIPTEALYSILPLRIKGFLPQQYGSAVMLPSDITKISGSDFDVDKLFILLKHFTIKDGKVQMVEYDINTPLDQMTTEQLDNLYIDLCLAALRHKSSLHKFLNGGNFDELKLNSRQMQIISDKKLFSIFAEQLWKETEGAKGFAAGEEIDVKTLEGKQRLYDVLDSVAQLSLEEAKKFIDDYKETLDPLTPDTYSYLHNANTLAKALIGFYAINSVSHAKMEGSNTKINIPYKISVDGVELKKIDEELSPWGVDIAKECATYIAASVDAVKDNALAGLLQNPDTAKYTNVFIRMGLSPFMIGVIMNHPVMREFVVGGRKTSINNVKIADNARINLNMKDLMADIALNRTDSESATSLLMFMKAVSPVVKMVNSVTQINRGDTYSGAIDTTIPGMLSQIMRVLSVNELLRSERSPITLTKKFVTNEGKFSSETKFQYDNLDYIQKKIKDMTIQQVGYSLGIESATTLLQNHIAILHPKVVESVYTFQSLCDSFLTKKQINVFLRDFQTFLSSRSSIVADEDGYSFYQKRDYFVNEFPARFVSLKRKAFGGRLRNTTLNFITVDKKTKSIILKDANLKSKAFNTKMMSDFDRLINSEDPIDRELAVGLYLYCYYTDSLKFGPNNFGQRFSPMFINKIGSLMESDKELISLFNKKNYEFFSSKNEGTMSFNNFLDMFINYRWKSFVPQCKVGKAQTDYIDGKPVKRHHIAFDYCMSPITNEAYPYIQSKPNPEDPFGSTSLYRLVQIVESDGGFGIYEKVETKSVNQIVYNANDTFEGILEKCADVEKKRKTKSSSTKKKKVSPSTLSDSSEQTSFSKEEMDELGREAKDLQGDIDENLKALKELADEVEDPEELEDYVDLLDDAGNSDEFKDLANRAEEIKNSKRKSLNQKYNDESSNNLKEPLCK